jgi:LmbE family N-acetylglucosaminyl deacetylase
MTEREDDPKGTARGSSIPKPVHDLVAQLHGLTDRLAGLTGLSGIVDSLPGASALPSLPRPASLSAAQLKAITGTVAAQRRSIEAMQAQLQAFNEQLAVMEKILDPLTEWANLWTDLEESVMGRPSPPEE